MEPQLSTNTVNYRGGRVASDGYRATLAMAGDFAGLEEGVDRYALLLLVKKTARQAGFTPRMVQLLDYYFAFTRACDWEEGSRPIVYQSLSRTALDLGVTERQIQKLEAALFAAGAIGWNDSGNHRRYGQRCPATGRQLFAFGVELTPLAYLRPHLEALLHEKQLHDEAWLGAKREISWHRRQIRAALAEWASRDGGAGDGPLEFERRYDAIAIQLRTHIDLAALRTLLSRHRECLDDLLQAMGVEEPVLSQGLQRSSSVEKTGKGSSPSEPGFTHYKSTTQGLPEDCSPQDTGFQESVAAGSEETGKVSGSGLAHVTLGMALGAASDRLGARLPAEPCWEDMVAAAYDLRRELGVSQASWAEACELLGRSGAAVGLLVADRAALREEDPVRCPAAYFRGLVSRARRGELRLHASVFGLLERGSGAA